MAKAKKRKKKTHKAISKRVKKTKSGKVKVRKAGQDHFNAREKGKKMRNKRRDRNSSKANRKTIKNVT